MPIYILTCIYNCKGDVLAKWICTMCEWIYDEEAEGVLFNDLPEDWMCPLCGADKSLLEKL